MSKTDQTIDSIRQFNRFYTKQIGLLNEHLLDSQFSLTEARIMYELAHNEKLTATILSADLQIDAGLLSRILREFEKKGFIIKAKSKTDARQTILYLTEEGRSAFQNLDSLSGKQINNLIESLTSENRKKLIAAMSTIETILESEKNIDKSYILRYPQPGDFGWVIQKNGEVYADEYAWDEEYEGLVAGIVAGFIKNFNPKKERCWIAEKDGENIGSVFLVRKNERTAQLRLLLVDPRARGLGIGRRLVAECTKFARRAGYQNITLWTNSLLTSARHIYEKEGYKLVKAENHHSFGHDLTGETWELELSADHR